MTWPDGRSEQKALVLPDDPIDDPTPSAVTKARRGVAAKSFGGVSRSRTGG